MLKKKERKRKIGCLYCEKKYDSEKKAKDCFDSHKTVLVPMAIEDINRLVQFIYTRESKLIPQHLVPLFKKYLRRATRVRR